jgi:hypothetical protein
MHEHARRDVRRGESDHDVVLENRLAFFDCARSDLVARGHLALDAQAFALELRADRQIVPRDDDVVVLVQADGKACSRSFADFDHLGSPSIRFRTRAPTPNAAIGLRSLRYARG